MKLYSKAPIDKIDSGRCPLRVKKDETGEKTITLKLLEIDLLPCYTLNEDENYSHLNVQCILKGMVIMNDLVFPSIDCHYI
ncbi:hypothetical protein BIV59_09530 [Bacillus sp. MUM 13]|nr:hypothetical protein BIV59_09530 [Bacillus sp. MUM 13]